MRDAVRRRQLWVGGNIVRWWIHFNTSGVTQRATNLCKTNLSVPHSTSSINVCIPSEISPSTTSSDSWFSSNFNFIGFQLNIFSPSHWLSHYSLLSQRMSKRFQKSLKKKRSLKIANFFLWRIWKNPKEVLQYLKELQSPWEGRKISWKETPVNNLSENTESYCVWHTA